MNERRLCKLNSEVTTPTTLTESTGHPQTGRSQADDCNDDHVHRWARYQAVPGPASHAHPCTGADAVDHVSVQSIR